MQKSLACALSLSVLSLAVPIQAETVYVPILEPVTATGSALSTHLWLSNFDAAAHPYATQFLTGGGEEAELKEASATVPARKAAYLNGAAAPGETGLLAVDAPPELTVNAWVQSGRGKNVHYAGLPVISEDTQVAAGATAYLNGVGREGSRDVTQLALINLGDAASQCQVDVVAEDGTLVREAGSVEVPAKSMSLFEDALGLRGAAAAVARISCDQPFYALASLADSKTSKVSFVNPSDSIEQTVNVKAKKPTVTVTSEGNLITFDQKGLFHTATPKNAKKILRVPVPQALSASKVLIEFDVVAGPWNPRYPKGAHNLIFFHRGRFRGNTLANINAFGPGNYNTKSAQNIDLPAHYSTFTKLGFTFQQGQTYHISNLYDATTKKVTYGIYQKGRLIKGGQHDATLRDRLLTVPGAGLVAEFGNYNNQELPEVSSLGWRYLNLHVEIVKPNL